MGFSPLAVALFESAGLLRPHQITGTHIHGKITGTFVMTRRRLSPRSVQPRNKPQMSTSSRKRGVPDHSSREFPMISRGETVCGTNRRFSLRQRLRCIGSRSSTRLIQMPKNRKLMSTASSILALMYTKTPLEVLLPGNRWWKGPFITSRSMV